MIFNNELDNILRAIADNGGRPMIVGGYVRDHLMGGDPKDIDIEVYGLSYDRLIGILQSFGQTDLVGQQFGIIKLKTNDYHYDFSLPRKESKCGVGHKQFMVEVNPDLSLKVAAARRDFTMNSIAMDMYGQIFDCYNGQDDIQLEILKPTTESFCEDPLRLLRGFQFIGRFGFRPHPLLKKYADQIVGEYSSLSIERVWDEWVKWALKSKGPNLSKSLHYLVEHCNVYPEINSINGVPQEPEWHPEGDVLVHTGHVLDAMADICERENISGEKRIILIFAALCHDFGKATTTKIRNGRITSYNHEREGIAPTTSFLKSINCPAHIIDRITPLVKYHMVACQTVSTKHLSKLSRSLGKSTIRELTLLIEADQSGRPPKPKEKSANLIKMIKDAEKMGIMDKPLEPIVKGAHLIEAGFPQCKEMGTALNYLYELQIRGNFKTVEEAIPRLSNLKEFWAMRKVSSTNNSKPTLEFPDFDIPTSNIWPKLREKFKDHKLGQLVVDKDGIKGIYIGPHLEIVDSSDGPVLRFKKVKE